MFGIAKHLLPAGALVLGAAVAATPAPLFAQATEGMWPQAVLSGESGSEGLFLSLLTRGDIRDLVTDAYRQRLAVTLHQEAVRLHPDPSRWSDAAVLHLFAAEMRGTDDPGSVGDLIVAANLFYEDGEGGRACAALEKAGDASLAVGDIETAELTYRIAAIVAVDELDRRAAKTLIEKASSTGQPVLERDASVGTGCAEMWNEIIEGLVVPAPTLRVIVEPPDIEFMEELDGPRIELPELAPPDIELPPIARW
ncbi:MAG: hypothetical protein ACE5JR_06045 [Gemmatimonadota bacterium]